MRNTIIGLTLLTSISAWAGQKKVLDHSDFDRWESVYEYSLSRNGEWNASEVYPQEGDGVLTIYNVGKGTRIEIPRGYHAAFTPDSKWAVALIKPFYKDTRNAKIKGKKGLELPQDSLALINLKTGEISRYPGVPSSYKISGKGNNVVAWSSCDTAIVDKKVLKDSKAGRALIVKNLDSETTRIIKNVKDYSLSENGGGVALSFAKTRADSLSFSGAGFLLVKDDTLNILEKGKHFYGLPVFNKDLTAIAFTSSPDSAKTGTLRCNLMLADLKSGATLPKEIKITAGGEMSLNQYTVPSFSENGKRLIAGIAPVIAPDDTTLVKFETPSLDIWRWDAPATPPQERNRLKSLRERTFPVVIDLASGKQVLLTDSHLCRVVTPDRWDGDWALLIDSSNNIIATQWDYQADVELKIKNVITGEEKNIATVPGGMTTLSPADKFVVWFDGRNYQAYEIATGATRNISQGVDAILWDEDADRPVRVFEPYGRMGFTDNDSRLLVYDKFDVWSLDPKGESAPFCVTAGEGRKRDLTFRYIKTDPEERFIPANRKLLYSVFNNVDKRNGFATAAYTGKPVAPHIDFLEEFTFNQVVKALNADVYAWVQGNFSTSPNVYVSQALNPSKTKRVSDSNPQMKDYSWGTATLFKWHAYNGQPSDGILYLPEDFNPDKEYPMLVYFYETYSHTLFKHYTMEPSWSWINFPFYVSRGYVVFVPDIHFNTGLPGESSYNYVCSGVEAVCDKYPNIDRKRIGIDGQSWGGYQTAYLVTRTNMFACAGSGAPVANMTSAFGGIRWGSGDSRQGQYEVGQSRIGRNLWEAPELYLANSPLFHADRVNTPLLIMHNDDDGAVPWYQGIEMFMALRRLGKPVWMLQYNGEAHNLKERRNRKDITKRLQQFFDHYLKGDPMPEWMKNGISPLRKGQEFGY